MVVAVPRSIGAPHAVIVNQGLRYPKRNGATTRYLSEPEVAAAYRDRLRGAADREHRVAEIEQSAIERLRRDDGPWLLVSLVPDLTGEMIVSARSFTDFQRRAVGSSPFVVRADSTYARALVGQRCFIADDTIDRSPLARRRLVQLHSDGAGIHGTNLHDISPRDTLHTDEANGRVHLIWDELLVLGLLSGLHRLGRHARDVGAGSGAVIRAQLVPSTNERPVELGHTRHYGFAESRSGVFLRQPVRPAESAATVDDLAEPGPALVAAAALLADELAQALGSTELGQLSRDGLIRRPYWTTRAYQADLVAWAEKHCIEVTDETIS